MAAVVQQAAFASALGHRPGSQGGEPGASRRGPAERVNNQPGADLPAVVGPDTADANRAAGPVAVGEQRHGTSRGRQRDVVPGLHRPPKRVLHQRPPRADRDEPLVALAGFRGQQLVLPVLPRAQRQDVAEDVRRPVKQNLAAEREKVVRLAEMRNPGPVPALEQPVRVAGDYRPVALYQEHATAAAVRRRATRKDQPAQPRAPRHRPGPWPHAGSSALPPEKTSQPHLTTCP
jgi:hypothetical protein